MSTGPRVLLLTLSERTSGRGNRYMSGWLGNASVVAFPGKPDKHGNPTWDVFVSTPEPRPEAGQERPQAKAANFADLERDPARRPQARDVGGAAPAKHDARPAQPRDGWQGSAYRRPANGAKRAPAGDDGAFVEDSLEDIGRG